MVAAVILATTMAGWAQDIGVSAKIDKTTTEIRSPVTLTITLTGDLSGLSFLPPSLPPGFVIAGRSQATNFAMRAGAVEQSVSIVYVLVPQQPGIFKLGPFAFQHRGKIFQTEPIEITVKRSVLPPTRQAPSERFTI